MLPLSHLQHVSVYVQDLEKMKKFYTEVLGLEETRRPDFPFPGIWLQAGEGLQIHLSQVKEAETERPISSNSHKYLDHHFALATEDFEGLKRHLDAHGIEYVERPFGLDQLFIRDPEGNLIELSDIRTYR